jgi:hypothetical protein
VALFHRAYPVSDIGANLPLPGFNGLFPFPINRQGEARGQPQYDGTKEAEFLGNSPALEIVKFLVEIFLSGSRGI